MGSYHYWIIMILMMTGLYVVMAKGNLIKKVIGLNMFQVSVIMFYVSMGKINNGTAPILDTSHPEYVYSNPLPHVLMLTAIVVGIATAAVALALVVRINDAYGTIEDEEIQEQEIQEQETASQ